MAPARHCTHPSCSPTLALAPSGQPSNPKQHADRSRWPEGPVQGPPAAGGWPPAAARAGLQGEGLQPPPAPCRLWSPCTAPPAGTLGARPQPDCWRSIELDRNRIARRTRLASPPVAPPARAPSQGRRLIRCDAPGAHLSPLPAIPLPQVTFIRDGKEKTCEVGPNDYMLDAADASRIEVRTSCRPPFFCRPFFGGGAAQQVASESWQTSWQGWP